MMIEQSRVHRIKDLDSLARFLRDDLSWDLPEASIDDVSFEWTGVDLNLSESIHTKLKDGVVRQLQPFSARQPWGIFVIEFAVDYVSIITLRQILRCFVAKRRGARPDLPAWQCENLLFICLYGENGFTFAHFKGAKPYSSKLTTFSWHPGEPIRTVCEFNLPALEYDDTWMPEAWVTEWQKAFDVEKVNKQFYRQLSQFYYRLTGKEGCKRELVLPYVGNDPGSIGIYEEFAVRLIGRSIFCWFLKHKLSEASRIPLIPPEALSLAATRETGDFYHSVLEPLFFEVMNKPREDRSPLSIPRSEIIPFLNGGLFEPHHNDFYTGEPNYGLKIPDAWFIDFFGLLERYNFTITENSSIDVDVAVDPEMLGRIFENLLAEVVPETGETARKATGSYYTPRAIVDYMVEQSLKQYLLTNTELSEERVSRLLDYGESVEDFLPDEKLAAVTALREIKVIDPACGSGAFPMGILHRMLAVLEKVDPRLELWQAQYLKSLDGIVRQTVEKNISRENWAYIRKLMIIRDSIYGVDIQQIAVEIAKLRCFLSLIVDELILDDEGNRGVEPLPNLEFKFVAANSLIGLPPVLDRQVGLGTGEEVDRLRELRNRYLRSYGEEKKRIEEEFRETRGRLIEQTIQWGGKDALALQLIEWDPFSYRSCGWFDPGWMFGIEDGFDIVIANPPYIKEYVNRRAFDGVRDSPYYLGKMDIWYLFACQGVDHLKRNGVLTFIAQNNWVTSYGAAKLRSKVISDTKVLALLDFGDYKIFQTSGIQTMVMVLSRDNKTDNYEFDYRRIINDKVDFDDILDLLSQRSNTSIEYLNPRIDRGRLANTTLTFSHSDGERLIEKIRSRANFHLAESEIAQGIVPNPDVVTKGNIQRIPKDKIARFSIRIGDGVFVVTRDTFEHLDEAERKYIKPLYEPSQMSRYYLSSCHEKEIIYITKSNFENDCPRILDHLGKYKEIMAERRENLQGKLEYYHLHWPRNPMFFAPGPKILGIRKCAEPTFVYSESETYVMMAINVIRTDRLNLKCLSALLNSRLAAFWLKHMGKMQGTNYQVDKEPLLAMPIYRPPDQEQEPLMSLVDRVLAVTKSEGYISRKAEQAEVRELERQIDHMVYQLYDLTAEEIATVEGAGS